MRCWQHNGDDATFKESFVRIDRATQDFELDLVVGSLDARWPRARSRPVGPTPAATQALAACAADAAPGLRHAPGAMHNYSTCLSSER